MKLAVSNIAWQQELDEEIYALMKKHGFEGVEIAPTRIVGEHPYEKSAKAKEWQEKIYKKYGFLIPSMQSIWYGKQERLFGDEKEQKELLLYTKKAIDFAKEIKCHNLVFGCPKNRNLLEGRNAREAILFFRQLGEYALAQGVVIGMEANPAIYNTNYINYTKEAIELIEEVNVKGFRLNLDVGTMIQNREQVEELQGQVQKISHVHISEPGLKVIEKRKLHKELKECLEAEAYQGFISIEMSRQDDNQIINETLCYVKEIFG